VSEHLYEFLHFGAQTSLCGFHKETAIVFAQGDLVGNALQVLDSNIARPFKAVRDTDGMDALVQQVFSLL
jgi:hypothetical protein